MLIVLSLYFVVVWLVFLKFKWLPWNRTWKTIVFSIAAIVAIVVVGALRFYTPVSSGAVVQADTQRIFPLVSGQVISVAVVHSATVKEGDELFRLDPAPFQYALDASAADLRLAEIRLRDTRYLVERDAAAAVEVDRAQAEHDLAKARFDQATYELEHSVVHAPTDGVISLIALQEGEVVGAMTPVMNLFATAEVGIACAFGQNGMALMAPGSRATVVFSAAPGEIYETTVAAVAPALVQGQLTTQDVMSPVDAITSTTGLYAVMIDFPEEAPAYLRRPGTEASVTVFNDKGNPVNMLAGIIQWISSKLAYL